MPAHRDFFLPSEFSWCHLLTQNPVAVSPLKINGEAGRISGSLAIAPYVTIYASESSNLSMLVVDFPPTQLSANRIDAFDVIDLSISRSVRSVSLITISAPNVSKAVLTSS